MAVQTHTQKLFNIQKEKKYFQLLYFLDKEILQGPCVLIITFVKKCPVSTPTIVQLYPQQVPEISSCSEAILQNQPVSFSWADQTEEYSHVPNSELTEN